MTPADSVNLTKKLQRTSSVVEQRSSNPDNYLKLMELTVTIPEDHIHDLLELLTAFRKAKLFINGHPAYRKELLKFARDEVP